MKNVIKKIAAVAMAFTMLGTGTAITETIAPKTNNSIVASAASYAPTCKHSGSTYKTYSAWWYIGGVEQNIISFPVYERYVYTRCSKCGYVLYTTVEYKFK
ncbi:MAG: hypothetical protein E7498_00090 [Ruminococcus sp.]|nr:hypothetical protein [Ruminococcus sp.]